VIVCLAALAAVSPAAPAPAAEPEAAPPAGMVLIPAGEFQMGKEGEADHSPVHTVRLDAFYLDAREVTNAEYQKFCEETERALPVYWGIEKFCCGPDFPDHPIVGVSWADAEAFAEWAGKRLPTEAEWEYAARGGLVGQPYPSGEEIDLTTANFRTEGTIAVGSLQPNGYGLYDMGGNVREWVVDYYDPDYYQSSPVDNPTGPERAKWRVVRGGGWFSGPTCQSVHGRNALPGSWVDFNIGFRCARDVE